MLISIEVIIMTSKKEVYYNESGNSRLHHAEDVQVSG